LAGEVDVVEADVKGAAVDLFDAAAVVAEEDVLALGLLHPLGGGQLGRVAHASIVLRAWWQRRPLRRAARRRLIGRARGRGVARGLGWRRRSRLRRARGRCG